MYHLFLIGLTCIGLVPGAFVVDLPTGAGVGAVLSETSAGAGGSVSKAVGKLLDGCATVDIMGGIGALMDADSRLAMEL